MEICELIWCSILKQSLKQAIVWDNKMQTDIKQ